MTRAASTEHSITEVRAPTGARLLEVTWSDGHESAYSHELLRRFCPCATCQGHQGPIAATDLDTERPGVLELVDLEEVGRYALRFRWGDGHATGIYSFSYLRRLCPRENALEGQDTYTRTFSR